MAMCEDCGIHPATVRVSIVFGEEQKTRLLCVQCMTKLRHVAPLLHSFAREEFLKQIADRTQAAAPEENREDNAPYAALSCPSCHTTYADFRKERRLGCADCYDVFRMPLEELLAKSGPIHHVGRTPREPSGALSRRLAQASLRKRLAQAIASEDYEEAALLRDQLHSVQQEMGEGGLQDA